MTVTDAAPVTKKEPVWQRHRRLAIAVAVPPDTNRAPDPIAE